MWTACINLKAQLLAPGADSSWQGFATSAKRLLITCIGSAHVVGFVFCFALCGVNLGQCAC